MHHADEFQSVPPAFIYTDVSAGPVMLAEFEKEEYTHADCIEGPLWKRQVYFKQWLCCRSCSHQVIGFTSCQNCKQVSFKQPSDIMLPYTEKGTNVS